MDRYDWLRRSITATGWGFRNPRPGTRRSALIQRRYGAGPSVDGVITSPSLVEVAHGALRMAHPDAERHWLDALADVDEDQVRDEIRQVSADVLSETSAMFCHRLLTVNRRRLLDVR